jgi:hypothetical protein
MLTAPLTIVNIRCLSVVYVNYPLIVLNISCPSVNDVNLMLKTVRVPVSINY